MNSVALTQDGWQAYRDLYLSDPWEFALDICGLDLLVERFHKPLIYLMAGATQLICDTLAGDLDSAVLAGIRSELVRRKLNWADPEDFDAIDRLVHKQNDRLARKLGKTSCGEVAILWNITNDPNQAWMLVSRDDPSAEEMCSFIGKIILSEPYRAFFPDRIPDDPRQNITRSSILLAGRTRNIPQPCVTAAGHDSGWTSKHFSHGYGDDLTGLENKSPAKLKIVRQFQANKDGLKMPEMSAMFHDVTVGTRWARADDSAALEDDPDCLNLRVPIETRTDAVTFENMLEPGIPVLPEWYDAAKVAEMKISYLVNKEEGPQALLANLFLVTPDEGVALFKTSSLRDARFTWSADKNKRLWITRPALNSQQKPILDELGRPKVFRFDPHSELAIVAGVDPAVSYTGDKWAVTALGRDPFGVKYQLQTISGRGFNPLVEAIKEIEQKWHPQQIGIENAATQTILISFLSKEPAFHHMVSRIVPVSHKNLAKTTRMVGLVAAPMDMRELLLNPLDTDTVAEMRDYDPNASNPQDAIIDSIGIAMTLYTSAAHGQTDKELIKAAKADDAEHERRYDPEVGIEIDTDYDGIDDDYGFYEEAI